MKTVVACAIQMCSGEDKEANQSRAERLIDEAVAQGARLIVLPETFNCCGRSGVMVAQAEPIPGPTTGRLARKAAAAKVHLVCGSILEKSPQAGKAFNTSVALGPDGATLAVYRKIHLFDVAIPGQVTVRESDWLVRGDAPAAFKSDFGTVGMSICYDLRFPELYRALAARGATVMVVPSAFTEATGRHHWEVLLRARAIENQCYVLAANQCGQHASGVRTHGHSMVVDPWGKVLVVCEEGEGVAVATMDLDYLADVRRRLPALAARFPEP